MRYTILYYSRKIDEWLIAGECDTWAGAEELWAVVSRYHTNVRII